MKIMVGLKNDLHITDYHADCLIITTKFSSYNDHCYHSDVSDIINKCHFLNKEVAVSINKIFHEFELLSLEKFLQSLINLSIEYFIFSDWAVFSLLKKMSFKGQLIYSASTLVCSYQECMALKKIGVQVILSNELPLEDIEKNVTASNVILNCYGYLEIFYSKRPLVSLYNQYMQNPQNKQTYYYLQEETRQELYPLIENENGTYIFTPKKHCLFKELDKCRPPIIIINSLFIPEEKLVKIIELYQKAINRNKFLELEKNLFEIDDDIDSGFLYKKPAIFKEKI